jgi:predicted ATP-grasp superfamily ATP-dependent carboligase
MMVQAMIPGDGRQQFAFCAFYKDGRTLGSMMVRRTRQHPPEFGRSSTYVETLDVAPLVALSERFLSGIDYYGLVELEYKLDGRDGEYKLLDVNGRTWGYHTLGYAAGVDFPFMLYSDQVGEPVTPCAARTGVKWIRLVTDLPTGVLEVFGGRQNFRDYVRTLRGFDVESVFNKEDLLPGLAEVSLLPYLAVRRGF